MGVQQYILKMVIIINHLDFTKILMFIMFQNPIKR